MLADAPDARVDLLARHDDEFYEEWKERELSRFTRAGLTYLDYTGAALYAESLIGAEARRLECSLLGNPHSEHGPSRAATAEMEQARRAVLEFLHADPDEYAVIFTANATAACKLVGESFPFLQGSTLVLTADNHNSVNGVREYAGARGAEVQVIPLAVDFRLAGADDALDHLEGGPSLFGLPAQSNFTGVRHPLSLIAHARSRGICVLLDAASFLATADLRLDVHAPDFVALSIYKIAGYPTGVGALVARHDALERLERPWFSGGTVRWASVEHRRHLLANGPAGWEDGTPSFASLGAVPLALGVAQAAERPRLARHLQRLTAELIGELAVLRHGNGNRVVELHGPADTSARGPTVALTIRRADDTPIPFWIVEDHLRERRLAARGGCFCNPGCAERAFGIDSPEALECLSRLGDAFTIPDFAACYANRAVGAIRLSMGLGTTLADVRRAVEAIGEFRD